MPSEIIGEQRDKFVERMLQSASGVFDIFSIYIGHRLGFYDALAMRDSLTSGELASHTNTNERCVREWLEQQTVAGILEVEDETAEAKARKFRLPSGHAEVLVDRESLNYLSPLVRLIAGAVHPLEAILNAYRTGDGVPYSAYGADLVEGQAAMNRAMFLRQLGQEWLAAIPDVHIRLQSEPPARVADVGCGAGWSCIGIAQQFPKARVDGFDLDEHSIDLARENAASAGLSERVNFHVRNAADPQLAGRYDLVTAFECIHDMSNPVGALRVMRNLCADDGTALVVDERVGDTFTAKGSEDLEWMMYGWSVLHCLLVGMTDKPSAETGTVMRPDTFRRYAAEAGFSDVEILPIDHFFFRFYRLHP
jgi:2-polyprenyl-3-methyl-5-hydroxy-6-metoxy-1,4-benzoquinol methylase